MKLSPHLTDDLQIGVVTGGWSGERAENLRGAREVTETLRAGGASVTVLECSEVQNEARTLLEQLMADHFDFALLCVTEEVPVQGALSLLGTPHSGSGVLATASCFDKLRFKRLLCDGEVEVPRYTVAAGVAETGNATRGAEVSSVSELRWPIVVKPARCGSSLGVSVVDSDDDLDAALEHALQHDTRVLAEEFIGGDEITVTVVGDTQYPPVVVTPPGRIHDTASKEHGTAHYSSGESLPARLHSEIDRAIENLRKTFDLENVWRADFKHHDSELIVLEVNTLPYLGAPAGALGKALELAGVSHFEFLTSIVDDARTNALALPDVLSQ